MIPWTYLLRLIVCFMKNPVVWILAILLIGGVLYWLLAPQETEAPIPVGDGVSIPSDASDADTEGDYIGLTEVEAEARAESNEVLFRVVERNGEMLPTTRDYRPGRINATVDGGVVTSYTVEGSDEQGDPDANRYDFGDPPANDGGENGNIGDADAVDADEHDAIIGMTEAEAEAYAEEQGVPFRIGSIDGEPRPLTMDYRPGRITASLEEGVVVSYSTE